MLRLLQDYWLPRNVGADQGACPSCGCWSVVLQLFSEMGLCIDASSGYEIERAMRAGVKPESISLSSQELPPNFDHYVKQGVTINACSLSQLDRFGQRFPGGKVRAALLIASMKQAHEP